jgi:HD-GYP domain-containing protein (c-di-GMP phosphodiesterase class II)
MRSARVRSLACVGLLAFGVGAIVQTTGALDGLERDTLSRRFEQRGAERPTDVVVVAIDAKSFDVLRKQWPFPRSLHGKAIRRLHAAGAGEIVYDVQFTEPTTPREDLSLYRAIGDAGGAVLATSESDGRGHTNVLGGDANLRRVNAQAAASDLHNDDSGAIIRVPRSVEGLDTIAVVTARRAGRPPLPAKAFGGDGAWIDWRGPPGTIRTVSFSDVVQGRFAPGTFRDKVVVIGASAPTLRDVHATPVGGDAPMSGAEVQANAIWTALHGAPLRGAPTVLGLLLIALLALMAPVIGARFSAPVAGLAVFVTAGLYLVAAQLAFDAGLILDVVAPVTALLIGGFGTIAWSQLAESRARQAVARDNLLLERRVRERTHDLWLTQVEITQRLGVAVEWRDTETGRHIERIGRFCERLALEVGMPAADAELLRHASALHDVGKVGIPDHILTKPGPLTPEEWELMQTHTTIGANILSGSMSRLVQLAETIALTHHEHWDGGGYPRGLRGEAIPISGRICAICDVFDALLSPRPYKDPWPFEQAIAEIERLSGTQFAPGLVAAFLPIAAELHREWFPAEEPEAAATSA